QSRKTQAETRRSLLEYQLDQHRQWSDSQRTLTHRLELLECDVRVYREYERVFSKNNLPFHLMTFHLISFNTRVNEIFEQYTRYRFSYDQSEQGKLLFLVTHRETGLVLESERLSGFESIVLQLAFNYAILS